MDGRQHAYHTSQEGNYASQPYAKLPPLQSPETGAISYAGQAPSGRNVVPSTPTSLLPVMGTPQQATPPRSGAINHGYSHSSPPGIDHGRFVPFLPTPDASGRYKTPQKHRYTASQAGGTTDSIYSPLGLADIRTAAEVGPSTSEVTPDLGASPSGFAAPWPIYALDWCKWPARSDRGEILMGKMALGSYVEDGHNFINILEGEAVPDASSEDQYRLEYRKTAEATHSYPVTRILWEPASSKKESTDLLATSGDHLRLWSLPSQSNVYTPTSSIHQSSQIAEPTKLMPLALLSNSKSPEHTAPLTSLDWNSISPSLIITSSIDTTCTIWDIPTLTAKTQLIAHDKEVFDVRFCANSVDVFVSCGADGSVRMFDLRSLEHSTIIYEPTEKNEKSQSPASPSPNASHTALTSAPPLLRLAASPHDAHLLATFSQDSNVIRILDVRQPGQALLELQGHAGAINCLDWSPTRRGTLASGADDSLVLIWDLLSQANNVINSGSSTTQSMSYTPLASWQCEYEVNNLSWAPQNGLSNRGTEWLGVSGGRSVWGVCV